MYIPIGGDRILAMRFIYSFLLSLAPQANSPVNSFAATQTENLPTSALSKHNNSFSLYLFLDSVP